MKYEFTGTVRKPDAVGNEIVLAIIIMVFSVTMTYGGIARFNQDPFSLGYIITGIILIFGTLAYVNTKYNRNPVDENELHGEICKIRLYDKYIEIVGEKKSIGWDAVINVKEHWYLQRYERSSKEIQIDYDLGEGKRRIYLIETPDIGSSKSRYVNTQVNKKKYDEVLDFLKTKAKFVGKTFFDV